MRILDVDRVSAAEAARLTPHLTPGEEVLAAFSSATGAILFTDRRLLIVVREHLLEEKVETMSYPYREVRHFSILESGGSGAGGRSAIRIWLGAEPQPLHLRSESGEQLHALQRLLADRLA